jgi:hypothetical protein
MKQETILVLIMGLFLLLLFLIGIATDAVAAAILPTVSREERSSSPTDLNHRTIFGADVVKTSVEAVHEAGTAAITPLSRNSGRLVRLRSGNTTGRFVADHDLPVCSLAEGQRRLRGSTLWAGGTYVEGN